MNKKAKLSTEPYKGVRDFYPEEMFIENLNECYTRVQLRELAETLKQSSAGKTSPLFFGCSALSSPVEKIITLIENVCPISEVFQALNIAQEASLDIKNFLTRSPSPGVTPHKAN